MKRSAPTRGFSHRNLLLTLAMLLAAGIVTIAVDQTTSNAPPDTVKLAVIHLDSSSGATGASGVGKLHDRDTNSDHQLSSGTPLILQLDNPTEFRFAKIHGAAPYRLSVDADQSGAWQAVAGMTAVDLSVLSPGWNRLAPTAPLTTGKLRFRLEPIGGANTGVREIELWGGGTHSAVRGGAALLTALQTPTPPSQGRLYTATPAEGTISAGHPVTFTFTQNRPVEDFKKVWVTYELSGESHWVAAVRAINGRAPRGGHLLPAASTFSTQLEPVNPQWLVNGDNRITFSAAEGATTSYTVKNVNILGELEDGANFAVAFTSSLADSGNNHLAALSDGDPATGWKPYPNGNPTGNQGSGGEVLMDSLFDKTTQLDSTNLILAGNLPGTISIDFFRAGTWVGSGLPVISGNELAQGANTLPTPSQTGVDGIRLRFTGASGNGSQAELRELFFNGSGVGPTQGAPALNVAYPNAGQFWGRYARIRGFLTPIDNGSGRARITVGGIAITQDDGAFEMTVNKDDVGLATQADNESWSIEVKAVYPDSREVKSIVTLDHPNAPPVSTAGRLLPAHKEMVRPGQAKKIAHDGALLTLGADAVLQETELSIRPLAQKELAALDPGMDNVTAGPRAGYRFGPHPFKFKNAVNITLPYDPALIPRGLTANDVHTFYFDNMAGSWKKLPRQSVNAQAGTISSATNHFTDMINATITMPDHPNPASFDANTIKGIKAADPGAKINLIQPPSANSKGDAMLSYPIEIPSGRKGLQPSLNVVYNSSGGNGWMGLGWDIPLSAVTIDTRWGVPRYDPAAHTETYLLDGEMLSTVGHRGEAFGGSMLSLLKRVFDTPLGIGFQNLGSGSEPKREAWIQVNDPKSGIDKTYGGYRSNPSIKQLDPCSVLADPVSGKIFKWMIRDVRDAYGVPRQNLIEYNYQIANSDGSNSCLTNPNTTITWRQIYVKSIRYTGKYDYANSPYIHSGAYEVRFNRRGGRPDPIVDGRAGFKVVTDQLLDNIEVLYHTCNDSIPNLCDDPEVDSATQLIRKYKFKYDVGPFGKSRLIKITQCAPDAGGTGTCDGESALSEFNHHDFEYYHDVDQSSSEQPGNVFCAGKSADSVFCPQKYTSGSVVDGGGLAGGSTTAIGGTSGENDQGHLYLGLAPGGYTKQVSGGVKIGVESSKSDTMLTMMDIDGDGLPDQLIQESATGPVSYRKNMGLVGNPPNIQFAARADITGLPSLTRETSSTFTRGLQVFIVVANIVGDSSTTDTKSRAYFVDFNGDGLPDLVKGDHSILFNHLENGVPVFSVQNPIPIEFESNTITSGIIPATPAAAQEPILDQFHLLDPIRKWVAPYPNTGSRRIKITGTATLASNSSDGVRFTIQKNNAELPGGAFLLTSSISQQFTIYSTVVKGDRFYFRINSRKDGAGDVVSFNPGIKIEYCTTLTDPCIPDTAPVDENGMKRYIYEAEQEFALGGWDTPWQAPIAGQVNLSGYFNKGITSDDVVLQVLLNNNAASPIYSHLFEANQSYENFLIDELFNVQVQGTPPNEVHDKVSIRIVADSRVNLSGVSFKPLIVYPTPTRNGEPIFKFVPPVTAQIYPRLDPVSEATPYTPWIATTTGTVHVSQEVFRYGCGFDPKTSPCPRDGWVTLSVKRINVATLLPELLIKQKVIILNGEIIGPYALDGNISVTLGEKIYFLVDSTSPVALNTGASNSLQVNPPLVDAPAPFPASEFHLGVADAEPFGGGFRNWYFGEYNGNATPSSAINISPIDETRLHLPANDTDVTKFNPMIIFPKEGANPGTSHWQLSDVDCWISASSMSATRKRKKSFDFSGSASYGGCPLEPANKGCGVTRRSSGDNNSVSVSAGVNDGVSSGSVWSDVDFMDINGDRYPDVVGNGVIQGTLMNGAMHDRTAIPDWGETDPFMHPGTFFTHVRETSTESHNIGLGTTTARQLSNSIGRIRGLKTEQSPYGLSAGATANKGTGTGVSDLIDMNGDGLPDHVKPGGCGLIVRLNLGYTYSIVQFLRQEYQFGSEEYWCGPQQLFYEKSVSIGLDAGASGSTDPQYSFGGGVSATRSVSATEMMLTDVNGDGLTDWIRKPVNDLTGSSTGPMHVSLNNGNGFGSEFEWKGALARPAQSSENAITSVGFHFSVTIPIPPTFAFSIIINPGYYHADNISGHESAMMDIDGDGYADHVYSDDNGNIDYTLSAIHRTNLLHIVRRPMGGVITLDYDRAGNTTDNPHNHWVLSKVIVNDGHPGEGKDYQAMRYSYQNGVYSRVEREFFGFKTVTSEDWDYENLNPITLMPLPGTFAYRQAVTQYLNCNFPLNCGVETTFPPASEGSDNSYYLKGLPASVTIYSVDSATGLRTKLRDTLNRYDTLPIRNSIFNWGTAGNCASTSTQPTDSDGCDLRYRDLSQSRFPALEETVTTDYDMQTGQGLSHRTAYEYDGYDNRCFNYPGTPVTSLSLVCAIVEDGDPTTNLDDRRTEIKYSNGNGLYNINPITAHVYDMSGISGSAKKQLRSNIYAFGYYGMNSWEQTKDNESGRDISKITFDYYRNYGSNLQSEIFNDGNLKNAVSHIYDQYGYPTPDSQVNYQYDPETYSRISQISDSFGYMSSATYDPRYGSPEVVTDKSGNQMRSVYDSVGRISEVFGPNEFGGSTPTIQFEYNPKLLLADQTSWALTKHLDLLNPGNFIETALFTDGLGRVIQTKKDVAVNGVDKMSVSGCVEYDPFGRVVTQHYPIDEAIGNRGVFNATCDTVRPSTMEYDILDRVKKAKVPDDSITGGSDPSFAVTTSRYDIAIPTPPNTSMPKQLRISVTDPKGNVNESYLNARKQVSAKNEINAGNAQWTSYGYNPLYDVAGTLISASVDQITSVTDAAGNVTTVEYDMAGRRTAIDNLDTGRTTWTYNIDGNVMTQTTANLRALDPNITSTCPAGDNYKMRIFYDYEFGRLRRMAYPNAAGAIQYPCGSANNMRSVQYNYGQAGSGNGAGRISTVYVGSYGNYATRWQPPIDPNIRVDFSYDKLGQITQEIKSIKNDAGANQPFTTDYSYDTWGRLLTLTLPDANREAVSYGYDSGGNLRNMTGASPYVTSILYDKFEQRTSMLQGNGVTTKYTYDPSTRRLNNLSAISAHSPTGQFQNLNYTFDPVGNIASLANSGVTSNGMGGPTTQTFRYDDLNRLTRAGGNYSQNPITPRVFTLDMTYDSIHNITSKIQVAGTFDPGTDSIIQDQATSYPYFSYQYDPAHPHRLSFILRSDIIQGVQSFFYDANGNHTESWYGDNLTLTRTLDWDEENRLLKVTQPGTSVPDSKYQYDAGGQRTVKQSVDPATSAVIDETIYVSPNYVVRNGAITTRSYFAGTQRIATRVLDTSTTAGGWSRRRHPAPPQMANAFSDLYYFHPDHLGSTGFTTDDQGRLYEHIEYFPFGETWVQEAVSSTNNTPYLFTGKELDQDTGLYYYGARYYDPRVSVWQSVDPAFNTFVTNGGVYNPKYLSVYSYVFNNPVGHSDPTGACELEAGDGHGPCFDYNYNVTHSSSSGPNTYFGTSTKQIPMTQALRETGSAVGRGAKAAGAALLGAVTNAIDIVSYTLKPILPKSLPYVAPTMEFNYEEYQQMSKDYPYGGWYYAGRLGGAPIAVGGMAWAMEGPNISSGSAFKVLPLSAETMLTPEIAATFAGGKYTAIELQQAMVAYRYSGGVSPPVGSFLTTSETVRQISSPVSAHFALNLPKGATAETLNRFIIPSGTRIYTGGVAGGAVTAEQIYIQNPSVLKRF